MRVLKKSIWPHQVKLESKEYHHDDYYFDPRVIWLEEKWGKDRWYVLGPNTFAFKTQEDATLFLLRWT